MNIEYRLGSLEDLGEIICLVKNCIIEMESNNIFQWDKLYPTSEDFIEDINNNSLYIGLSENKIVVIFVLIVIFKTKVLQNKQCNLLKGS